MTAQSLLGIGLGPAAATAVILVTGVGSVVKLVIREISRSARLGVALKDSEPSQRPEILRAAADFEGKTRITAGPKRRER